MENDTNQIEQLIYTTNPLNASAFESFASYEKNKLLDNEILELLNCAVKPGVYDKNTKQYANFQENIRSENVKVGEKRGLFGKKDITKNVTYIYKNKIELIQESNSGDIRPNDKTVDFRDCPENAPFKIIKGKLRDGRIVIGRVAYIGQVYASANGDQRNGNVFNQAFILPKGVDLTDEEIKQINFQYGLDYKAILANKKSIMPKKLSKGDLIAKKLTKSNFLNLFRIGTKIVDFQNEQNNLIHKSDLSQSEIDHLDKLEVWIPQYENKLAEEMSKVNPQDVLIVLEQEKQSIDEAEKRYCERNKKVYKASNIYSLDEYKVLKIIAKQAKNDLNYIQSHSSEFGNKK